MSLSVSSSPKNMPSDCDYSQLERSVMRRSLIIKPIAEIEHDLNGLGRIFVQKLVRLGDIFGLEDMRNQRLELQAFTRVLHHGLLEPQAIVF
jgi:hypothetical protein